MPFVDISSLHVTERLPGWYGRYFHSASMTFAINLVSLFES
jgi:unsaturated pyranuronate lyase